MESVVWQCSGCQISIDPEDDVIEFIERSFESYGDTEREIPLWHYAHVGHEAREAARGYARAGQGKLRDLRAKRRAEGSDRPAGEGRRRS
jgi:hypothetical protein